MNIDKPHGGKLPGFYRMSIIPLRVLGLFLLFQFFTNSAFAQAVINGQVRDENSKPVAGVTVQLKNAANATVTDESGNFSLSVPTTKGVLVFTFVGYAPKEVGITGTRVDVQLQPASNSLNEVVVVGYATQRKVSLTGAVDKIGADAIEGKPVANVS